MKTTLLFKTFVLVLLITACSDEYDLPTVNTPIVDDVEINNSIDIGFEFTADAGYSSSSVTTEKGNAIHLTEIGKDAVQGLIYIKYTSDSEVGSDNLTFIIKDKEGNEATSKIEINVVKSN